ncbi:MAG: hypothetical protein RL033_5321 [Pseudomonadota bacterium]|jgi:hypothetical protein
MVLPGCAADEQSLLATAQSVATSLAAGQPDWEIVDVVARLRAEGSPYVWPRLWTVRAPALDSPSVAAGVTEWLAEMPASGQRRCGVGRAQQADGSAVLSVLAVDALAELDPLPTRVRLGQWLRLRARLLVPVSNAETVLLGPRGVPRVIPSELRPGEVRSVFTLDQPGMWRIQLLLATDSGPRPALEAWAFVEREPNPSDAMTEAPGESLSGNEAADPSDLLWAMLNAARRSEQRLPLRRDERLDQLARAHAEAMSQRHLTAHDAGDGLPSERLRRAGIAASLVGENVAYASNVRRAHRALWDSPAHRGTSLDARFEAVGLGVVVERVSPAAETPTTSAQARSSSARPSETAGSVWVCELFANYR